MPTTKQHARWCRLVVGIFPTPYHTPTMKPHQQRCDFVLGVFFSPYHGTRQSRNDTPVGVVSWWASAVPPSTHAEHEMTPLLVSFHARILSYPSKFIRGVLIKYFIY